MRAIIIITLISLIYYHYYSLAVASLEREELAAKTTEVIISYTSEVKAEYTETQKIIITILESDLRFKRVVIAQMLHETNMLQSNIYRDCNNLFGMKVAYKRKSYATGTCRKHAGYKSVEDSIKDYMEFQKWSLDIYESKYGKVESEEAYLLFLKRVGYAEDSSYLPKLRSWLAKFPDQRKFAGASS